MRSHSLILLLFAVLGLGTAACDYNETDRNGTTGASPSPTAAAMSDSDLENRIKAQFDADSQLRAADLDIDANVSQNSVTLSGTVPSEALRTKAVNIARSAHSGIVVNDKIDVEPREVAGRGEYSEDMAREERERARSQGDNIGDSIDDAWLHAKISSQLMLSSETPSRKINVDVNNNVVTLRGTVESAAQKAEAERIAKGTEGVRRVVNQLKVGAS